MKIMNITAYKFIVLEKELLLDFQKILRDKGEMCQLKGTILLSCEGINLMVAGKCEAISIFQMFLGNFSVFNDLFYRESFSFIFPFKKFVVQIKEEIITMRCSDINPEKETAPHVSPETFHHWYQEKHDMVVLDIRNDFEVNMGTFIDAIDLNIQSFSNFPQAIDKLSKSLQEKLIVTFCTGGIRCEKAAMVMLKRGFKKVYQLDGGILNYFEKCGETFFKGKCFVFDDRISIEAT